MEKWKRFTEDNLNDNSDSSGSESDQMCNDEPIDLKQVTHEKHSKSIDVVSVVSNDWESLKLVKSKAFRIKDILGLEENEKKLHATQNEHSIDVKDSIKSSFTTPTDTCTCVIFPLDILIDFESKKFINNQKYQINK